MPSESLTNSQSEPELSPSMRAKNGDELANALAFLTGEIRQGHRGNTITSLSSTIQIYHRRVHGDSTGLLVTIISSCGELADACRKANRRLDAIKALDTAIALQRVVDRRRRHRNRRGSNSGTGNTPDRGGEPSSNAISYRGTMDARELDLHNSSVLQRLMDRAILLFEGGHSLHAAQDWMTMHRMLRKSMSHIRNQLKSGGQRCAANQNTLVTANADPTEAVRLESLEKHLTAIQQEFSQLQPVLTSVVNSVTENIATCLRVYGSFSEAHQWLAGCENSSERILSQKALCELVQAAVNPEDVTAAIGLVASASSTKTVAASLGIVQAVVQQFLSVYAAGLISRQGVEEDDAIRIACEAVLPALTNNRVRTLTAINEGLPEEIMTADKHVVHSVVTVMNFATSFASMDVWNAVIGQAAGKKVLHEGVVPLQSIDVGKIASFIEGGTSSQLIPVDISEMLMVQVELERIEHELSGTGGADGGVDDSFGGGAGSSANSSIAARGNSHIVTDREDSLKESQSGGGGGNQSHHLYGETEGEVTPTTIEREFDFCSYHADEGEGNILDEAFVPEMLECNDPIMTPEQRQVLHDALPVPMQRQDWRCIYSTDRHGTSLQRLYSNCFDAAPVLLVVRLPTAILGAYLLAPIRVSSRFSGLGETFVFSFRAVDSPEIEVYRWSQKNDYFCLAKRDAITIGGGGGPALRILESLESGSTFGCATFDSPPLTLDSDAGDFEILGIEVLSIEPPTGMKGIINSGGISSVQSTTSLFNSPVHR